MASAHRTARAACGRARGRDRGRACRAWGMARARLETEPQVPELQALQHWGQAPSAAGGVQKQWGVVGWLGSFRHNGTLGAGCGRKWDRRLQTGPTGSCRAFAGSLGFRAAEHRQQQAVAATGGVTRRREKEVGRRGSLGLCTAEQRQQQAVAASGVVGSLLVWRCDRQRSRTAAPERWGRPRQREGKRAEAKPGADILGSWHRSAGAGRAAGREPAGWVTPCWLPHVPRVGVHVVL